MCAMSCGEINRQHFCDVERYSRISPMRDGQTPERDRLPHYGPRFSPR